MTNITNSIDKAENTYYYKVNINVNGNVHDNVNS